MFTRYFLLLLCFTATSNLVQAQRFDPGFLVRSTGDTLRGEIENNFWVEPPQEVRFRSGTNAAITVYKPNQISSFALTPGRFFRRELLPIDQYAETRLNKLRKGLIFNQKTAFILAEVLVEGEADLLRVALPGAVHYWVRRENQDWLELTERLYLREQNNKIHVADGNNYQAQLYSCFGDCASVAQLTATTPYTTAGLSQLVQTYNQECSVTRQLSTDFTRFDEPKQQIALNGGVVGGSVFNTFISSQQTDNNRPRLLGGLYLDMIHGGRRTALHFDLTASAYTQKGNFSTSGDSYTLQGKLAVARIGGRGFIPIGRQQTKLFYGLGVGVEYFWDQKSWTQSNTSSVPRSTDFVDPMSFRGLPYLELGVRKSRGTFALNVHPYRNMGYDFTGRLWSFSATAGFRLNANPDAPAGR